MELSWRISDRCRGVWEAEGEVHIPLTLGGKPMWHAPGDRKSYNGYRNASVAMAPKPTRTMITPAT